MQRPRRVGAHELDLDALAGGFGAAVGLASVGDRSQHVVQPRVGRPDVDEPRPRHLDLLDERRRRAARRRSPAPRRAAGGRPAWRARARRWWRSPRDPSAWAPAARAWAGRPRCPARGLPRAGPPGARRRARLRSRGVPRPIAVCTALTSDSGSNGFVHVVDHAQRVPPGHVVVLSARGEEEHRHRREFGVLADAGTHLVAVEPGHHHIQHDRVRAQCVGLLERFLAAAAPSTVNPPSRKLTSSSRRIDRVVVDEQHAGASGSVITRAYPWVRTLPASPPPQAGEGGGLDSAPAAPVAQGIERRPPEPGAQVRILPGAPCGRVRLPPDDRSAGTCGHRPGIHEDRSAGPRRPRSDDPIAQFLAWLADAEAAGVPLPNAMALATADAEGAPSVRHVLLRGVDARRVRLLHEPREPQGPPARREPAGGVGRSCGSELDRQVHVRGPCRAGRSASSPTTTSPPAARGADSARGPSHQSEPLADREELERRLAATAQRFPATTCRGRRTGAASG